MGKLREKTRWSQVDWIQPRRKLKRNPAVGPRFGKQQSNAVEQEIISEFCCVEDLPDGFTKIRSKNLDIIFKRDFYENKMMIPPGFYPDGEMTAPSTVADLTACQSSVTFDQLDLDEIPEFRPRDGSFNASICNDSGYSSSFHEVFPEQLQYPPPPPPPQYLPYQVGLPPPPPQPQFYLYSPGANTLIPCEEIILSKTILSPDGPVYQSPTKAYVAYPVQGPDGHGYITQPFTGPEILSSPEPRQVEEEESPPANFRKTLPENGGRKAQSRSKRTPPGIKQLPTDAPAVTNYIPGLPLQSLKTKKRRKKKSKSKLSEDLSKVSTSSSDSEARETSKGNEGSESNVDLFDFEHHEVSEPMNEVTLTDDLTNSLVNPPTEEDDIENTKIAKDLRNLMETEKVFENPTNVHCSYSEVVRKTSTKEIVLKSNFEETKIPTESGAHLTPVKLSTILVSKSKNKSRKKKPKVKMEEVIEPFIQDYEEEIEEKTIESKSFCEVIEETPTEVVSETLVSNDSKEEEEVAKPVAQDVETPTEEAATVEVAESSSTERSLRPRKNRKKKSKERPGQSALQQRVLVVDDQVDLQYCQDPSAAVPETKGGQTVSSYDLLVIKDLGHGMSRGVMDLERPFLGSYVPPDRQYPEISDDVGESQSEVDQVLNTNEILLLD